MTSIGTSIGTIKFEVEWCPFLPPDGAGGVDIDKAKYRAEQFWTRAEALERAKKVFAKDQFGSVRITKVEFVDPYGDGLPRTFRWKAIADSEYYEGE